MICINCGKKIEYEAPVCKYCDEPIVLEGLSPMGDISSKVPEPRPAEVVTPVRYEMRMATETYAPKGIDFKKFIPLIVGGACAMVLLVVALVINLPTLFDNDPDDFVAGGDPHPSQVYDTLRDETEKYIEAELEKADKDTNNGNGSGKPGGEDKGGGELPHYIDSVIPYLYEDKE